jgi:hypothetical protein
MKNWIATGALLLVATFGIVGCASVEKPPPKNPVFAAKLAAKVAAVNQRQNATVVIYRVHHYVGWLLTATVTANGADLVDLHNGKVFVGAFSPGHYSFASEDQDTPVEADLHAGQLLYLKVAIVPGMWKGGGRVRVVSSDEGSPGSSSCDLVDPSDILNQAYR